MKAPYGLRAGWLATAVACLTASSAAEAAQQGTLGATSTGSVGISVSIAPRVQISGLEDVQFALVDPATGARKAQAVCVWSNSPSGAYTLTAAGSGAGGAFELAGGEQTVGYSVEWSANAGQTSGEPLTSGATQTNLQAAATSADCASGSGSASLMVAVDPAQLASAEPGAAYTGALTLIVSPQ